MDDIVLYLPAGGHAATAGIARGSAIVGRPQAEGELVRIYFEGALYGRRTMPRLADRAVQAAGRLRARYPTVATRVVPREALLVVGTFDFRKGQISLIGPDSESAVAAWLGTTRLDSAELNQSVRLARRADPAHLVPDVNVFVNPSLGEALIERAGILREDQGEWTSPDGRRTSVIGEALLWALVALGSED